jgi:hypothetical protein
MGRGKYHKKNELFKLPVISKHLGKAEECAKERQSLLQMSRSPVILFSWSYNFFSFGATAHIWALAYLHETFRFTSVY